MRGHLGSGAGVRLAVPLRGVELAGDLQAVARQEAQPLRGAAARPSPGRVLPSPAPAAPRQHYTIADHL